MTSPSFLSHARHIFETKDLGQGLTCSHRFISIPPSLVHQLSNPAHIQRYCYDQAIRRKSNRQSIRARSFWEKIIYQNCISILSLIFIHSYELVYFLDCIHTKDVPDDVFDLYCWIHSTYTIPRALSLHVGSEVAHPGVMASNVGEEEERRYVSYYQWVGFCLFFQVCNL